MTRIVHHHLGDEDDLTLAKHPTVEASDQIVDATLDLNRRPEDFLHMPWAALDGMVGGIAPSDLWFVGAYSGHGKTTFLTSALDAWYESGKSVYYMGLESKPKTLRTHWACKRLGLDAGDVLSGKLMEREDWQFTRERIKAEINSQMKGDRSEQIYFSPRQFVDADSLHKAAKEAAALNSDVFIIDHVDHLEGEGQGLFEQSTRVLKMLLWVSQEYSLRVLAATQFNNEMVKGNRLGLHLPPTPTAVWMGGFKRMISSGMIGLYRPLKFGGIDDDTLKSFAKGNGEPQDVCEPNVMAVSVMKHRLYGNREGRRVFLRVEKGKVVDLPEHEGPNVHSIRTNRNL